MVENDIRIQYPVFYRTCRMLQGTLFYRNILTTNEQALVNHELAEKLCSKAFMLCHSDWNEYERKLKSLLELNVEFLRLQRLLEEQGTYRYSSFAEVEREVFKKNNPLEKEGVDYLWGSFFAEVFWPTHHRLLNFFINEFASTVMPTGNYLDAPMGSGIFLTSFLEKNPQWKGTGVDLSDTAIDFTNQLVYLHNQENKTKIIKADITVMNLDSRFDRITCVEFLEHVERPLTILRKMREMLADGGKLFLSTVAWTAFIDHIYLYKSALEIREHISESGFRIEKEYVQSTFPRDSKRIDENNISLRYAAILVPLIS